MSIYKIKNSPPENEDLLGWATSGFQPEDLGKKLLSRSPKITARDVLNFTIVWVFDDIRRTSTNDSTPPASIDKRTIALGFVIKWLGQEHTKIPSLSVLCAQKLAAKMAIPITRNIDQKLQRFNAEVNFLKQFENEEDYNKNANRMFKKYTFLKRCPSFELSEQDLCESIYRMMVKRLDKQGIPPQTSVQECVLEELCIFIIVYLLYIDLRIAIPDKGRGRLAKYAIIPYSVLLRYYSYEIMVDTEEVIQLFAYTDFSSQSNPKFSICHPLVDTIALPCIIAFFHFYLIYGRDDMNESEMEFLDGTLCPYIKNVLSTQLIGYDSSDEYSVLLRQLKAKSDMEDMTDYVMTICENPYKDKISLVSRMLHFIDTIETRKRFGVGLNERFDYYKTTDVERVRLNGNFSKLHMAKCVFLTGASTPLLDLQHCTELDEELLDGILTYMKKVKYVWFKGTSIDKHSEVVQKFGRRCIRFDFTGESFKCWRQDGIKNDFVPVEKIMDIVIRDTTQQQQQQQQQWRDTKKEREMADNKEADTKPEESEVIIIRVRDLGEEETFYKIKKTTELNRIFNTHAQRKGVHPNKLRFLLDGNRINGNNTPGQLELYDQDQIYCVSELTGGSPK